MSNPRLESRFTLRLQQHPVANCSVRRHFCLSSQATTCSSHHVPGLSHRHCSSPLPCSLLDTMKFWPGRLLQKSLWWAGKSVVGCWFPSQVTLVRHSTVCICLWQNPLVSMESTSMKKTHPMCIRPAAQAPCSQHSPGVKSPPSIRRQKVNVLGQGKRWFSATTLHEVPIYHVGSRCRAQMETKWQRDRKMLTSQKSASAALSSVVWLIKQTCEKNLSFNTWPEMQRVVLSGLFCPLNTRLSGFTLKYSNMLSIFF